MTQDTESSSAKSLKCTKFHRVVQDLVFYFRSNHQICAMDFLMSRSFSSIPFDLDQLQIFPGVTARHDETARLLHGDSARLFDWHRHPGQKVENGHRQVESKNLHRTRNLRPDRHLQRPFARPGAQKTPGFHRANRSGCRGPDRSLAVHELRLNGPSSPCSSL